MEEKKLTFEEKMKEIESIIQKMDSGTVELDEMLKLYEKCQTLIQEQINSLNEAKEKIKQFDNN